MSVKSLCLMLLATSFLVACSEQGKVNISVQKQEDEKYQDCLFNFTIDNQTASDIRLIELGYKYDQEYGRPLILSDIPAKSTKIFDVANDPIEMIHRGHETCDKTFVQFLDVKRCDVGSYDLDDCKELLSFTDDATLAAETAATAETPPNQAPVETSTPQEPTDLRLNKQKNQNEAQKLPSQKKDSSVAAPEVEGTTTSPNTETITPSEEPQPSQNPDSIAP